MKCSSFKDISHKELDNESSFQKEQFLLSKHLKKIQNYRTNYQRNFIILYYQLITMSFIFLHPVKHVLKHVLIFTYQILITKKQVMKKKLCSRPKTPNQLESLRENQGKKSEISKYRNKSTKDKKQKSFTPIIPSTPKILNKGMSVTKMKQFSLSKALGQEQIQFVSKHLKMREGDWKTGAKNKRQLFDFISVIGIGIFGKVWKVKEKNTGRLFAIKQMSKAQIIQKKGLKICMNQRSILPKLDFHLVPTLYSAFETQLDLYMVFPWLSGGDIRYHITKFKYFEQKQIRFFAACIILALEYLGQKNILHRDIKPENLILDQKGYLYLADYGISSNINDSDLWIDCGTPAYMAPQTLFGKQPGVESDYYSFGVILYEMIMGERPYQASDKSQLKLKMSQSPKSIRKQNIPDGWSVQSIHFVNQLLHRNYKKRLGITGIAQLKDHPWFINFPWTDLEYHKLQSPYKQCFKQWQIDYSSFQGYNKQDENQITIIQKKLLSGQMQELFTNFSFDLNAQKSVEWTTKHTSMEIKR